jgi:TP901 family phage tail tape measure protein
MNFISSITLQFKDAFSSGFTSAQNSFAGMKDALGKINENQAMNRLAADLSMAAAMTEPFRQKLSALMDEPSKLAGTFDSSMRNIQSLTNESNASLAALGQELLAVGSGAVAGPNAIADAYYNIASGIGRAEVRMDTLRAAVALAESGQADLGAATSGLISVVNAYGTPAEHMGDLSDVFFQTVRKGVGSLDGFVSSMSSIAGLSSNLNIGFDELGSSMAYITAGGQTESVAATQLKAAMIALLKPNKEMSDALQSLGVESGSALVKQYGLAESLYMVKSALGGSDDAMAKALGSAEALQASIKLTEEGYTSFSAIYADGLSGATTAALEAQAQSYESKVARLQAASDSLKIQMGGDINAIKGFFVDAGAGFLNHIVAPIMSSPVGGVFQGLAAGTGLLARGLLSVGGGALNAASQLATLTATMQNMGGFMKLFKSSLSLLGTPFKMIGGLALKVIGPIGAFGASLWAAVAPILPIVIGIAAIGAGIFLLIKNFDKVRSFLSGVPDWVLGVITVFVPFIGIPALIIKHWDTIKAFFVGLWIQVKAAFVAAWNGITAFFVSVWNNIVGVVSIVANWFGEVWNVVTGAFAAAWMWIKDLFTSVWEGIKGVVMGFVEWLQPVIDMIIAPFKAIGNVIGDIIGAVKGWFGETVEMGRAELDRMSASKAVAASSGTAVSEAAPLAGDMTIAAPSLAASAQAKTRTGSSGDSLLAEHLAAASRKGIAGTVSTIASDAFMGAGASASAPGIDLAGYENEARINFAEATGTTPRESVAAPWSRNEARAERRDRPSFTVQNLYLQSEDIEKAFDLYRQLEMLFANPQEAAV